MIDLDGKLSFDALQMRLHPAESRIKKLSRETPARLVMFDILMAADGTSRGNAKATAGLLMREINHRVKNQYAVVLAVIRQTATRARSIEEFEQRVRERIMALPHSHDLLSQVDWARQPCRSRGPPTPTF